MTLPESKLSLKKLTRRFLDLFALPPPLKISEWAENYRYLSGESSSKRGKWQTLPFQREPMDAPLDPEVESVVMQWASQTGGKTEVINNITAYYVDHDPSPILVLQPTVEMSEAWSKERFTPMVRDCPRLRSKIRDAKSRSSANTIQHKSFPGGHLSVVGANAPAGLAMRPIRILECDEVDRYPISAGVEGDPISLAEKRTEAFPDAIKIYTSTPTIKGASRIEAEFNLSDKRYWFVPCPFCGQFQTLKWAQVKWPEGKPEDAYYECENSTCQAKWTDQQRVDAIMRGEWRATAPFKSKRGYHLSGIYTLFKCHKGFKNRLHEMASVFLDAKAKGPEALKTWTNTFLSETWEQAGEKIDSIEILSRCESYGPDLPGGVLVLVGGADVQHDRIEAEIAGFGIGEESWGIRSTRIIGSPEKQETWNQLDAFLSQEFTHPSGVKLRVAAACIDSGTKPKHVYAFTRPRQHRRIYATKGSSTPGSPLVSRPRKSSVRSTMLFLIGTDTGKDMLFSRLRIDVPGPRYMHFPMGYGYDEEYFLQLTAEKAVTEFHRGFAKRFYIKTRERNEALDIRVEILAALEILNPDWSTLAKQLAFEPEKEKSISNAGNNDEKAEVAPPRKAPVRQIMKRTNWITRWKT